MSLFLSIFGNWKRLFLPCISCIAAEGGGDGEFFFSLVIFERRKAEELRDCRERQLGIDMQVSGGDFHCGKKTPPLQKRKGRSYS